MDHLNPIGVEPHIELLLNIFYKDITGARVYKLSFMADFLYEAVIFML